MVAIDTNIVVRLITRDDPHQSQMAEDFISRHMVYVSHLALVEAEWVMRSTQGYSRSRIAAALQNFVHAENICLELEDYAFWALDRYEKGADLADMFLLVAARDQAGFATFDRRLSRHAGDKSPVRVEVLA